ncbi:putative transcription fungi [Rosellinia necatrix]|uniref:Putative transcription fungi n=1 Tax=Rosellinia necatrix TaxID=77044 RepID=A0A1W2TT12_ROSNE|nr:putative transcription fungi [Rosellinia necatrix]
MSRTNWTENTIGPSQELEGRDENAKINYRAESRWTALCASSKEEILELFTNKDRRTNTLKESGILDRIEAQWQALPTHLRPDRSPK